MTKEFEQQAIEEFKNVWSMMSLWASALCGGAISNKTLEKLGIEI